MTGSSTGIHPHHLYTNLPACVDAKGHAFTIPPMSGKACCSRCGLIREQPKSVGVVS
jgi:hypothetical protein